MEGYNSMLLNDLIESENKILDEDLTFNFNYMGIDCEIIRHDTLGHLCGYINLCYNDFKDEQKDVAEELSHGGITFITDDWLGFDCAHYNDLAPFKNIGANGKYRSFIYVKRTIETMIEKILGNEGEKNMNELVMAVEKWSKDKDLHNQDPNRQALKVWEESGEVGAALSRGKMDDLKDAIGDTVVTLIILAQQHGWSIEECLQYAYDEIKDRKGETKNGTFVKESDL